MADVSGVLRATRERSGLTLEEISARTRIKVSFLQAIERGDFKQLPGDFFTRAFLRNYARELRLSPDDIVREYDASQRPPEPLPEAPPPVALRSLEPARQHVTARLAQAEAVRHDRERSDRALRAIGPARLVGWAVAPAVAIVLVTLFFLARLDRADSSGPPAVGTTGQVEAAPRAPVTAAAPAPAPAGVAPARAAATPERLSVEIRATGTTWISAYADGKRVVYRLFRPGDEVIVEGYSELSFRVGNAGAFEFSINGVPATPVGRRGDVREFTINLANYQSLLRTSTN